MQVQAKNLLVLSTIEYKTIVANCFLGDAHVVTLILAWSLIFLRCVSPFGLLLSYGRLLIFLAKKKSKGMRADKLTILDARWFHSLLNHLHS